VTNISATLPFFKSCADREMVRWGGSEVGRWKNSDLLSSVLVEWAFNTER